MKRPVGADEEDAWQRRQAAVGAEGAWQGGQATVGAEGAWQGGQATVGAEEKYGRETHGRRSRGQWLLRPAQSQSKAYERALMHVRFSEESLCSVHLG